jgi:hypothetical protein
MVFVEFDGEYLDYRPYKYCSLEFVDQSGTGGLESKELCGILLFIVVQNVLQS